MLKITQTSDAFAELERLGIYKPLLQNGVISTTHDQYYQVYQAYLREIREDDRETYAKVATSHNYGVPVRTVYRAISFMTKPWQTTG